MNINNRTALRVKRTLTALLLMFVLSFSSVFAETGTPDGNAPADGTQTAEAAEPSTGTENGVNTTSETPAVQSEPETPAAQPEPETPAIQPGPEPETPAVQPEPEPTGSVFKKGKYYYYKDLNGAVRKKAGFVKAGDRIYYVRKGGKIKTNAIFKVKKKYYCADKYGAINTGVYKWKGYLYYSDASGVMRRTAGFVTWNDNRYYVQKGGIIYADQGFSVKNIPYGADENGCAVQLEIPDGNGSSVVEIAKAQVGIMTGKTYWVWYYKTRFIDTDRTPWCGAFVAWCYKKAGLYKKISVAKKFGPLGYVPSYSRYADKHKKWVSRSKAKGGDVIVFGRNRHVGLVEGISGDYIITIEGNAGPTAAIGCKKPGAVVRNAYKIDSVKIKGIIRP